MIKNFIQKINYNPTGFLSKYILYITIIFFMWQHMYIYILYSFIIFFIVISFLKSTIEYKQNIFHLIAKGNKIKHQLNQQNLPSLAKIKSIIGIFLSIGILFLAYKNSLSALILLTPVLIIWFFLNMYLLIDLSKN